MVRGRSTEEVHRSTRTQHGGGTLWYGRTGACGGTMPGLGLSGSTGQIDEGGTLQQKRLLFSHYDAFLFVPSLSWQYQHQMIASIVSTWGVAFAKAFWSAPAAVRPLRIRPLVHELGAADQRILPASDHTHANGDAMLMSSLQRSAYWSRDHHAWLARAT